MTRKNKERDKYLNKRGGRFDIYRQSLREERKKGIFEYLKGCWKLLSPRDCRQNAESDERDEREKEEIHKGNAGPNEKKMGRGREPETD